METTRGSPPTLVGMLRPGVVERVRRAGWDRVASQVRRRRGATNVVEYPRESRRWTVSCNGWSCQTVSLLHRRFPCLLTLAGVRTDVRARGGGQRVDADV